MSTKSTIFLTNDNEHCYDECSEPHSDENGKWIGNSIVMEFDKSNIDIILNNEDDLIIELVNPKSEIYKIINSLRKK